jgi:anti-sigma factor RsiW
MTCTTCRQLLTDYTHGELDAAHDAAVFQHIQTCAECRAELAAETELTESIRAAFGEERELPMSVVAGVRQAMHRRAEPVWLDKVRAAFRPAILAPAAAVVLIAFGLVRYDQALHTAPALSSSYFVRQHVAQTIGSASNDRAWDAYLLTSANASDTADVVTP